MAMPSLSAYFSGDSLIRSRQYRPLRVHGVAPSATKCTRRDRFSVDDVLDALDALDLARAASS